MTNSSQPSPNSEARLWAALVEPIVKKCRLAIALNMNTSFNEDGTTALADLLEKLAAKLDDIAAESLNELGQ